MRILIAIGWTLVGAVKWVVAGVIWWQFGWVCGLIAFALSALSRFWWRPLVRGLGAAADALAARREFARAWQESNCSATLGAERRKDHYRRWARTYKRWGRGASEYLERCTGATASERAAFKDTWPRFEGDRAANWATFYESFYDWLVWRESQYAKGEPGSAERFLQSSVGSGDARTRLSARERK